MGTIYKREIFSGSFEFVDEAVEEFLDEHPEVLDTAQIATYFSTVPKLQGLVIGVLTYQVTALEAVWQAQGVH